MTTSTSQTGLIILAGGHSSRMGFPKAFLEVNGRSFTEMICSTYEGFCAEIIMVLNSAFCEKRWVQSLVRLPESMTYVINNAPERDKIHSLQLGASAIAAEKVFVHNVDQPFVSRDVIRRMCGTEMNSDVLIPTCNGQNGHPILINKKVLNELRAHEYSNIPLNTFLARFDKQYIETHDTSILHNVNTKHDLEKYFQDALIHK